MSTYETDGNESDGATCPTCGKECASHKGMKIHHKQMHGESLAGFQRECKRCGDEFEAAQRSTVYCSISCSRTGRFSGENNPAYDGGKVELSCENCGDSYKVTPAKEDSSRFCSEPCLWEWRSENETGENNPNWKGGDVLESCAACDGDLFLEPHVAEKDRKRFCDTDCYAEWLSVNRSGENHPGYKGGSVDRRGDWYRKRRETLARDDYQCRACGTTREDHYDEYKRDLEVHHVVPVREFDDPTDANSLGNLVTACIPCHRRYEGLPVFPR